MTLEILTFADVEPIWRERLWPGRRSPITAFNQIPYLGGYDPTIAPRQVLFLGARLEKNMAGVVSGYKTSATDYRVRGFFIFPEARRRGVASALLEEVESQARGEGCRHLWSAPREAALSFYLSAGFKKTSEWTERDFEFGPNCYVRKDLRP